MMKRIRDLQPGEIFLDSFGLKLKVEKLGEIKQSPIPPHRSTVRIHMETEGGSYMYMSYNADREVEIYVAERA